MEQERKVKRVKMHLLTIFMTLLLVTLILSTNKITDAGILFVYVSTWILILHTWLGIHYIIKYLKQENTISNFILDLVPMVCIFIGVQSFHKLEIWAISFAVVFTFAMMIYKIINLSEKNKLIQRYTYKKIRNEVVSVYLLVCLAALAYVFKGNVVIIRFLQVLTLASQFFFLIWLAYVKKVYFIFRKS